MSRFSFAVAAGLALASAALHAAEPPPVEVPPPAEAGFLLAQQTAGPLLATRPNPQQYGKPWILVGVKSQSLTFYDGWGLVQHRYSVSTARNGVGELVNSYMTPRGWHRVCEKIGDGAEENTIIFRRQVTPWKYTPALHAQYPDKDWILTRILWLCGMEPGKNQGGDVDSYDRAIYIHGAGEHVAFGTPTSLGCVRMRNPDVVELFQQAELGTDVLIDENG
ncbi:L,D-transpeptidase [Pseudogulbenkiania sp. MAI-1]|uniref:L,D-transpeptidase n=1 Tax=Pseudogulbenkiania sp. MAI-1 TaxID=990370 RepID=UPI00045EB094|nr:L,D-transpeptidase [Pseudogulbenkiania sp. MAI-1]